MDLTARAVTYITLAQDISYSVNPQPNEGIPSQPVVLLQNFEDTNDQLIQNYIPFQKRISEVVSIPMNTKVAEDEDPICKNWFSIMEALLIWMSQEKETLSPELCYYPLPLNHSGCKEFDKNKQYYNGSSHEALVRTDPYPAPQQWREAIRSVLYQKPEQRVELAKALYLPVLVEMACKSDISSGSQSDYWQTNKTYLSVLQNDDELFSLLKQRHIPLPFDVVYPQELKEINFSRKDRKQQTVTLNRKDPLQQAKTMHLTGLAFSGGGIRSATFNLGVLQGLAKAGLLPQFDYLSTVFNRI